MTLHLLATVAKLTGDEHFTVLVAMHDDENGMLGDNEFTVGPGETLFGRWAYDDIREGHYDGDGNYLGEVWEHDARRP